MVKLTALVLLALTLPAHAGGTAPGPMAALVPQEWKVNVFEVTCRDLKDCCDVHGPCSVPYQRRPDPVPLPGAGAMMLLGLAGLMTIRRMR